VNILEPHYQMAFAAGAARSIDETVEKVWIAVKMRVVLFETE
jgi:hypothetical protein